MVTVLGMLTIFGKEQRKPKISAEFLSMTEIRPPLKAEKKVYFRNIVQKNLLFRKGIGIQNFSGPSSYSFKGIGIIPLL